jgi:cytochrome P450
MAEFAFRLPVTVICELLGVPAADQNRFRPLAADLTEALEATAASSGPSPAATAAASELAGYFTTLIAERRTAPGDDLIGPLVAARDAGDGRLSDEELLANLIVLLVTGFETTTSLLGNGLAMLFDHPGPPRHCAAAPCRLTGSLTKSCATTPRSRRSPGWPAQRT